MENFFATTPDTSMFIPIFLFWSLGGIVLIALMSGLGCLCYYALWLPWMTPNPSDDQIADKVRQLTSELQKTSSFIRQRDISDQRATIPLDQAENYMQQANQLARQGKSKKRQLEALQNGLDQIADANHWLTWLNGFQTPAGRSQTPAGRSQTPTGRSQTPAGRSQTSAKNSQTPAGRSSTGRTTALDPRTQAEWQAQPRRFAVKARVFKRPFIYLDIDTAVDTASDKLLTFAEANGLAIMWEIDNEGDMPEAIVVDVHSGEVFPLFAAAQL